MSLLVSDFQKISVSAPSILKHLLALSIQRSYSKLRILCVQPLYKVPLLFPDSTSAVVSVIISQSSNGDDETLLLDDCWSSISAKSLKESGLIKKDHQNKFNMISSLRKWFRLGVSMESLAFSVITTSTGQILYFFIKGPPLNNTRILIILAH